MIEYKTGDILRADAEALVNTVNCVGVMGRGIALQFKKAFPENFKSYQTACKSNEVQPGQMFIVETGFMDNPKYIINFPTKRHWKGKSKIEDIEAGLDALAQDIQNLSIQSIAIPPLGSGLGGLHWPDVRKRIEKALCNLDDVAVIIYEPIGAPDSKTMARTKDVPSMTPGRAALVVLMHRYLEGLMDPFVTLLEVHKLMYFMQESGEDLKLHFNKAHYGPYAENLRHVLNAIEGHLISGYVDGGDDPEKQLELVPGAVKDATDFLQNHDDTNERFMKVADLVEGFESSLGLELLSTAHWVCNQDGATSVDEAVTKFYSWGDRKRWFSSRQIKIAFEVLQSKGWMSSPA